MKTSIAAPILKAHVSRRQFVGIGVGAFVVAGLPLAIHRGRALRVTRRTMPVMGTIVDFAVVHEDPAVAERAIDAAMAELRFVQATMTRFDRRSEIGQANESAFRTAVPVGTPTAIVVREALRWAHATNGAFDPAIGAAILLWDVEHRHSPPPDDARAPLARREFFRQIEVADGSQPRLVFHDPSARIDLGAIAKGYGVDRATDALRAHGIRKAVVEAGGDLYALGSSADGSPWQIGIQSPDDDRALAGVLDAEDVAIATSGTYRQFFRYRGVKYHHLLDPVTASPRVTPVRSFTVRADTCMHADVAATALYGRSADDANRMLAGLCPGARVDQIL